MFIPCLGKNQQALILTFPALFVQKLLSSFTGLQTVQGYDGSPNIASMPGEYLSIASVCPTHSSSEARTLQHCSACNCNVLCPPSWCLTSVYTSVALVSALRSQLASCASHHLQSLMTMQDVRDVAMSIVLTCRHTASTYLCGHAVALFTLALLAHPSMAATPLVCSPINLCFLQV